MKLLIVMSMALLTDVVWSMAIEEMFEKVGNIKEEIGELEAEKSYCKDAIIQVCVLHSLFSRLNVGVVFTHSLSSIWAFFV